MTPKLQKELDKIYDKNDDLVRNAGIADPETYVFSVMNDIANNELLKNVKFKLSFYKSKNEDDKKYAICKGAEIKDVVKEWSKKDPNYLFDFVLFGDN